MSEYSGGQSSAEPAISIGRDNQFLLDYNGVTILLESDYPFSECNFRNLEGSFAAVDVLDADRPESIADAVLTYTESDDVQINYDDSRHRMHVSGPATMFRQAKALSFTAGYMSECFRAPKDQRLLVHAAAVYSPEEDSSRVLFGEKGAGKTTLAIRLCKEYGFDIIGNDQVYLGLDSQGQIITGEGSKWFDVRETAIKADNYLGSLALGVNDESHKSSWNNKVKLTPTDMGVGERQADAVVSGMFNVRIDREQRNLYAATWQGIQQNLVLHEKFGRHITGQATPFQSDNGEYLGSLPSVGLSRAMELRDRLVRAVVSSGVIEVFGPDSDEISSYIARGQSC